MILLLACQMASAQQVVKSASIDSANTKPTPITWYFPVGALENATDMSSADTFLNNWYSGQLVALQEPVLYTVTNVDEVYRFTWLRSFHSPVAIRIERSGDKYTLYWKESSGAGGYDPGKLETDMHKTLDRASWDDFAALIKNIDFWQMPIDTYPHGNDGAEWILEGKTADKYHVVHRWAPKRETAFFKCCDKLITLSELKIKKRDKY